MQFLPLCQRKSDQFSDAASVPLLDAEAEQARTLSAQGLIRQIWNWGDVAGACMLIEAADEAEARADLQSLPLVVAGMLEIT